ncbi:hypothetical protein H8356DRAFT_1642538 [Neocallimastix lanati (nom. inval.)]|jgi:hypothetical protein|uniref:Uncharacterized protein n=1 Tax=Neocallimastix californiae TaxID=1754190 RepID=A0A1Y2EPN8_9FUNG|nr:hypothetical protein H8356DRAFT_1642538 [Neocallimastix sp. JGI-2020a]ORY73509.1 hypothetical protein LY90DRAFT_699577 [Neocallimastix californiae]|eukprot:ORY73509.1 hypothetical protein LY90DRAFT_699577 [Neocallimastix californiae]
MITTNPQALYYINIFKTFAPFSLLYLIIFVALYRILIACTFVPYSSWEDYAEYYFIKHSYDFDYCTRFVKVYKFHSLEVENRCTITYRDASRLFDIYGLSKVPIQDRLMIIRALDGFLVTEDEILHANRTKVWNTQKRATHLWNGAKDKKVQYSEFVRRMKDGKSAFRHYMELWIEIDDKRKETDQSPVDFDNWNEYT